MVQTHTESAEDVGSLFSRLGRPIGWLWWRVPKHNRTPCGLVSRSNSRDFFALTAALASKRGPLFVSWTVYSRPYSVRPAPYAVPSEKCCTALRFGRTTRDGRTVQPTKRKRVRVMTRTGADGFERLSQRAWSLLRWGDKRGFYGDDFGTACAIIAAAARVGYPKDLLWLQLTNPNNCGGAACRRGASNRICERRMLALYEGSIARFNGDWLTAADVRMDLATVAELVLEVPLPGDRSGSMKKVLLAHLSAAMKRGANRYYASGRRIADDAQVAQQTVRVAQERLQRAGLLRKIAKGSASHAAEWEIPVRRGGDKLSAVRHRPYIPRYAGTTALDLSPLAAESVRALAQHPCWRHGSGISFGTWAALALAESSSAADLADTLGKDRRTVQRHLAALTAAGLAKRFDNGTYAAIIDKAAMAQHAFETGMQERSVRQRTRHTEERAAHREALQQRRGQQQLMVWAGAWVHPETGEVVTDNSAAHELQLGQQGFGRSPATGKRPQRKPRLKALA